MDTPWLDKCKKNVIRMKLCHISKLGVHLLHFLFFDANSTWDGMQCKGQFLKRKVISRIIEAFQSVILLKDESNRSKLRVLWKKASDIQWLISFAKSLV